MFHTKICIPKLQFFEAFFCAFVDFPTALQCANLFLRFSNLDQAFVKTVQRVSPASNGENSSLCGVESSHKPCLNQSPSFAFPNCAKLFMPCSLKSMPFSCATSCVGALLTLCTMIVGSVSKIIPSSTISSIARETRS